MKPLPRRVLHLLETLPEETCKIVLNTNQKGHWVIEVFTRYTLVEEVEEGALALRQAVYASSTRAG